MDENNSQADLIICISSANLFLLIKHEFRIIQSFIYPFSKYVFFKNWHLSGTLENRSFLCQVKNMTNKILQSIFTKSKVKACYKYKIME